MLLRFGVENFRSIRDYTEVSMVASPAIKDVGPDLLEGPGGIGVLPFILVYGANASGKSSLYSSLGMLKTHVRTSFSSRKPDDPVNRTPFALGPAADKPTKVDCDFVIDGVRYHYGFECDDERYLQEWLYAYPGAHRRILFHRDGPSSISFGPTLKGRNKLIADLNRENSLFLSAAAQNNHPQLTPIYNFFAHIWGITPAIDNDQIQDQIRKGIDGRLIEFLKNADTGVVSLSVDTEEAPEGLRTFLRSVEELAKNHADDSTEISINLPTNRTMVKFAHAAHDGSHVELPFMTESRGTRRLIAILLSVFKALDKGGVLFVDELDASLHTLLAMKLIDLFADATVNVHGAQLVATTHDTNLLCSSAIRRDQIWFTEKDNSGATTVYPLTDIRTRNSDNLEKGYLQGRFGAIPYLGSVKDLMTGKRHG